MTTRIPARAACENFDTLLENVSSRGEEVIIERAGKPMGVIISIDEYQKLQQRRAGAIRRLHSLRSVLAPTDSLELAEQEILEETELVRHGSHA